jgi:hypothetical protein
MRRMLTAGVVLAALPLGSLLVAPGLAGASGGSVDATNAEISCSAVQGTVTFNPPLKMTNSDIKVTIAETVSSCAPTGVAATVSKGVVSATLKASLSCAIIGDSSSFGTKSNGSVVWTSSPRLSSGNTVFEVSPLHWGTDDNKFNTIGWSFGLAPTPSGSFQGNYHGQYDEAWADSTISASKANKKCTSASGLRSLTLKTPTTQYTPMLLGGPNPD